MKNQGNKFSVVSFFCGCGGMDLGFSGGFSYKKETFSKLPFQILAAYDSNKECIGTYHENFPGKCAIEKDLSNFNPAEMPKADILCGGFPCQDFAMGGARRGLEAERGRLYMAFIRYTSHHSPKILVGENVPGLESHNNGKTLKKIILDIERCGYRVETKILWAPDFGVPQIRKRLFIIAVRNDIPEFPEFPQPVFDKKDYRTVKWAIGDLDEMRDPPLNQQQYFKASPAKRGNGQGDEKLQANKPSYTIRANAKSRIQFHYRLDRRLTVRECARIQTFPDKFIFPFSATENISQIGNAVPPVLAFHVAKSIAAFMRKIK